MRKLLLFSLVGCTTDYEIIAHQVDFSPEDIMPCGFTQVGDTDFYSYNCNPVFSSADEEWGPYNTGIAVSANTVMGHPFYQAWYAGTTNSTLDPSGSGLSGIGYAASSNGTEWLAYPENPVSHHDTEPWSITCTDCRWDAYWISSMQASFVDDQYYIVYRGFNSSVSPNGDFNLDSGTGYMHSSDGVNWTKYDSPYYFFDDSAVSAGELPLVSCWPASSLSKREDGTYDQFQALGGMGFSDVNADGIRKCDIWRGNSEVPFPGLNSEYETTPEPYFRSGDDGTWYSQGILSADSVSFNDKEHLFFSGFSELELVTGMGEKPSGQGLLTIPADTFDTPFALSKKQFFGHAIRDEDGNVESWQDISQIPIHQTDEGQVSNVSAQAIGSRVHLWVTDRYGDTDGVGYFIYDPNRGGE